LADLCREEDSIGYAQRLLHGIIEDLRESVPFLRA
jgi:hypothetical protein